MADCKPCPVKHLCTGRNGGREIGRSAYQSAVDINNKRVLQQKDLYLRRQALAEHASGTIRRGRGYPHTLVKGLKKADGKMKVIALVYNLKRALNIMGINKMLKALKKWSPDYGKVFLS